MRDRNRPPEEYLGEHFEHPGVVKEMVYPPVADAEHERRANAAAMASIAIKKERFFQDAKYGHPFDAPHSIGAWLLTIRAELQEAEVAAIKGGKGRDNVISEITQIAALCMACLEQHGTEEVEGRSV